MLWAALLFSETNRLVAAFVACMVSRFSFTRDAQIG
jgi:hypothetical protein